MTTSSARDGKPALAGRVWQLMFELLMRTAPERSAGLARRGLTPNDSRALFGLDPARGRSMRALAQEWNCDKSNATWIVDRLERLGLARRAGDPNDRRVTLVVLTGKGLRTRRELLQEFHAPPAALLALGTGDLRAMRRLLEKLPPATD